MFGYILWNVLWYSPKYFTKFPGMFGDIPQNVWGHSPECLRTFPGIFEDIPWNVWRHSPEWFTTFPRNQLNLPHSSNQLNALIKLKHLLGFKERKVLVNTFVMSNFNYCSLVWNFSSAKLLNKIENLQKRALRFLFNDYDSTYKDLLEKSGYPNMNLRRQSTVHRNL